MTMSCHLPKMTSALLGVLLASSICLAVCRDAHAQTSAWADLSVPQGVASSAVHGQGKLITYDQGSTLHVFSSVTRRWHGAPKLPGATVRLFNDCVIITEPGVCRAFSSHTVQFVSLNATGQCTILNATAHKNDSIILVTSGSQLHAFSAFTGTWTSLSIPTTFAADVQRHVAVVHHGAKVLAVSAFDNVWHEHACGTTATTISANGTTAIASNAGTVLAFSAHTRSWRRHAPLANASFLRADDWALWFNSTTVVAYSSLRGTFLSEVAAVTTLAGSTDLYALLNTANGLLAYSAVTGDLLTITQPANAIDFGAAVALLHGNKTVRGYSPLRQSLQTLVVETQASGAGNSVAFVTSNSGQTHAFSSLTSSWVTAPAATNGNPATMSTTTVALQSPSDCFAFAARSGQFVAVGNPVPALVSNPTSAPLLGYDVSNLFAFDTDSERWLQGRRGASVRNLADLGTRARRHLGTRLRRANRCLAIARDRPRQPERHCQQRSGIHRPADQDRRVLDAAGDRLLPAIPPLPTGATARHRDLVRRGTASNRIRDRGVRATDHANNGAWPRHADARRQRRAVGTGDAIDEHPGRATLVATTGRSHPGGHDAVEPADGLASDGAGIPEQPRDRAALVRPYSSGLALVTLV